MWDVRHRPLRFTDVLGQEGSIKVLQARLQNGTGLDTSYLFSGGHGTGKTTLARIVARALLCQQLRDNEPCNECDNCKGILNEASGAFVELDAASRGTIDNVRAIVDDLPFVVPGAPKRIYLFDEAHRMSRDAQDVLLKPLEDKKLVGLFCTTEPEKIRGPIRSRCEEYAIRKVTREEIARRMKWVLEQEKVEYEEDAILTVIDYNAGHVRDILNRLEMVAQMGPVTVQAVRENLNLGIVATFYEILLSLGDPTKSVILVERACDRVGPDEVATGLAEAAMNAFRLARGLYADFALVDRKLAEQVYQMYGDNSAQVADYFLQSYRPSKIGLICDVVRCAKGIPTGSRGRETAPPVLVVAGAVPVQAPAQEAPATPRLEAKANGTTTPQAEVATAPVAEEVKPTQRETDKLRSDGVGSLGTGDPLALTEMDHKVVREDWPRGAQRKGDPPQQDFKGAEGGRSVDLIPSNQWRHEFEEGLPHGIKNGSGV